MGILRICSGDLAGGGGVTLGGADISGAHTADTGTGDVAARLGVYGHTVCGACPGSDINQLARSRALGALSGVGQAAKLLLVMPYKPSSWPVSNWMHCVMKNCVIVPETGFMPYALV